jgi:hypothetical protein
MDAIFLVNLKICIRAKCEIHDQSMTMLTMLTKKAKIALERRTLGGRRTKDDTCCGGKISSTTE